MGRIPGLDSSGHIAAGATAAIAEDAAGLTVGETVDAGDSTGEAAVVVDTIAATTGDTRHSGGRS